MRSRQLLLLGIAALAIFWVGTGVLQASIFTGSGTNPNTGQAIAASVEFTVSGSDLVVTLKNTGADVLAPTDVLTGVFFSLAGDPTLTRISAVLGTGSSVAFGTTDPSNVVGGEWAYKNGLVGVNGGGTQGISSAGLGLVGPGDLFPGSDLQPPPSPDGIQYGITSGSDNTATGNAAVTGSNGLIKNAVVFRLGGLPAGFNLNTGITKVVFQYGTALNEPSIPGTLFIPGPAVPEPASLAVWSLLAVAGVFAMRRRAAKS